MPFETSTLKGAPANRNRPDTLAYNIGAVPLLADASPTYPASLPARIVCRIVSQITAETISLLSDRVIVRSERRRPSCHVRQISMYVCHVALRMSFSDIGAAFGRDRTTVGHACHVVEDRRDDVAFDEFVSAIERIATAVFQSSDLIGGGHD
ncbi:helix-turn-helix domain-containing protein [Aliirhizobium smilacinae]|uniref:helix-turn-helix domain-containing protein n=1 Tax=Aliirhizobium smilacinae TaxID=1395944 RepID=UPI001FE5E810|nr:helix-turn-helix domain-containing protein [Rhizobium smilacinae]